MNKYGINQDKESVGILTKRVVLLKWRYIRLYFREYIEILYTLETFSRETSGNYRRSSH